MAVDTALFVLKRAGLVAAALVCLMAGRLAGGPTAPAAAIGEVRVMIGR